jgi:hypothetical protein
VKRLKRDAAFIALLALLVVVSVSPRLRGPIDLRWDAGVYYVLGTSLVEGKGYRLLNEPGQIQQTQYPPLLPASIAAVEALTGSRKPVDVGRWLRLEYLLLFAIYVFMAYAVARRYISPAAAFGVGFFCLTNAYTHFMADQATADLPYGIAAAAFVFFATARPGRMQEITTAAFCVAAYLLRTAGVALMLAWIGDALVKRGFRAAVIRLIICLLPIGTWTAYVTQVEHSPAYARPAYSYQRADYLSYNVSYSRSTTLKDPSRPEAGKISVRDFFVQRLLANLVIFPSALGQTVTSPGWFWEVNGIAAARHLGFSSVLSIKICRAIPVLAGVVVICGGFMFLSRRYTLIFLVMLFSAVLICATPWPDQMVRYAMPLNPLNALLLVVMLLTIKRFLDGLMPGALTWIPAAGLWLALAFLAGQTSFTLLRFYRDFHSTVVPLVPRDENARYKLFFYEPSYRALDEALDWIQQRATDGDILASSMPHWLYIRTGFSSVMAPLGRNPALVQRDLDSVPISFLVVQRGGPIDMEPLAAVLRFPALWSRVYSDKGEYVRIYRRSR